MQATLHTPNGTRVVPFHAPVPLLALLEGAAPHTPCGGNGLCGKCRVTARGALSAPSAQELALLGAEAVARGVRLACLAQALGDVELTVTPVEETLSAVTQFASPVQRGAALGRQYGLAADIGTTTVAAYLYRLTDGALLACAAAANAQRAFGADVLARLQKAASGQQDALAHAAAETLRSLLLQVCKTAGIGCEQIDAAVLTGNTAMLTLLARLDAAPLLTAPFQAPSLFGCFLSAKQLGLPLAPGAQIYLPPCAGAFFGADALCSLLAAGGALFDAPPALLADIGTNGEIALWTGGRLLCCSTAAGPAFEGAGLSCGMPAQPGAVDAVRYTGGALRCHVLGGGPARGICGSGVLDALAALRQAGILDREGTLLEEGHSFEEAVIESAGQAAFALPGVGLLLTQRDIRAVQSAKAAIRAGIETLLAEAALSPQDCRALLLAGGFGSRLSLASSAAIGLFPPALLSCARALGNAAAQGASMLLLDETLIDRVKKLADACEILPLAGDAAFAARYLDCMSL